MRVVLAEADVNGSDVGQGEEPAQDADCRDGGVVAAVVQSADLGGGTEEGAPCCSEAER